MNSFYKKNDIGVLIEYTTVGTYNEDGVEYTIYTDFADDEDDLANIRLYVAKKDENNELIEVDETKKHEIMNKLYEQFSQI